MNTNTFNEIAVETNQLTKVYPFTKSDSIGQKLFASPIKGFLALDRITVKIKKGSCFGILGQNGSGKSTFLQLIAGVVEQTDGEVKINGKLSAIFELGSGFNNNFTGRENISLHANIVGMKDYLTKDIVSQILEFAEIGDFIDRPVSTYSTGMRARLGFSVRAFLEFDILILDEVLAVGDMYFKRKCMRLLEQFKNQKKTIIFVSHNINQVLELCDEVMVLDQGKLALFGEPKKCAYHYYEIINRMHNDSRKTNKDSSDKLIPLKSNYGRGKSYLKAFEYTGKKTDQKIVLNYLEVIEFKFRIRTDQNVKDLEFGVSINTVEGTVITGRQIKLGDFLKGSEIQVRLSFENILNPGHFFLSCGLSSVENGKREFENRYLDFKEILVPNFHNDNTERHVGSCLLFKEMVVDAT